MIYVAYLDDIIVLSEIFAQHLKDLKTVINRLIQFKLRANRKNVSFFGCAKYLGHVITQHGIQIDSEKTAAVAKFLVP